MNDIDRAFYDVIIVGGGLVGTTLACALGDSGLSVALIEAQKPPKTLRHTKKTAFDPRVSALTLASKNLFLNLGVWPIIAGFRHCPFEHMNVWDADGTGQIQFDAEEIGQRCLGYIVENSVMVSSLFERLQAFDNIELIADRKVADLTEPRDGTRYLQLEDGRELGSGLVVGADGALSNVRQLAGVDVVEKAYRQQAIVTTVKSAEPHQATAWQRFMPSGPLAFLPLLGKDGDDHACSIVWSADTEYADRLMALDDDVFGARLERAFESRLGQVESVDRRFAFPLRERHARTYVAEGLALIGDAAHTIHPLAGQGVNLGLLDVAVLAEELLRARQRSLEPGHSSVLARYQRRRRADNSLMMMAMGGFKWLFGETNLAVRWARNTGMSAVNQAGPVKNRIAALAMGVEGDLPKLAKAGSAGT